MTGIRGGDDRAVGQLDARDAVRRRGVAAEQVRAGERRDERVARMRDELAGRADLAQLPVDDHADAVGERGRVLEVVGDEQDGDLEPGEELLQLRPDVRFRVSVERRERLVEQQDVRVAGERARERDALALAAREVRRAVRVRDARSRSGRGTRRPCGAGVLDVLADGQVREERVVLEDEPDASPVGRQARRPVRRRTRLARRR